MSLFIGSNLCHSLLALACLQLATTQLVQDTYARIELESGALWIPFSWQFPLLSV